MPAAEWYHQKAEECVALAKGVRLNEERARLYALAEYYTRLAMMEAVSWISLVSCRPIVDSSV